jgi:hypothetical protein
MKAYRREDGTVRLFRPDKNMARMNRVRASVHLPSACGALIADLFCRVPNVSLCRYVPPPSCLHEGTEGLHDVKCQETQLIRPDIRR